MKVYEAVILFEIKNNHRFAQGQIKIVGGRIKKAFMKAYPGQILPLVLSSERNGSFRAFDYPDHFIGRMGEIIADYAEELKQLNAKKISEKTAIPVAQKIVSPDHKKKRQRTKIPANKPVFSGSSIKK